ncbi:MAG: polysaccharide pyruvyl transferase CsaB, partial [Clostridiales bacterium]|nr:polysaccharide pyruvyl transferase CsaB [Clostridiales bacterium]
MKVLHLIGGGDVGGAKTHVLSLLTGLQKQAGCEILLVSLREGPFAEEARSLGIPTEVVSSGNIIKDFFTLRLLYERGGFDIVHCHGAKANMMGSWLKISGRATVVTTVHSDYRLDYLGRPLGNLVYGNINRIALRIIKNRICVSDPVAELLLSRGFSPYGLFSIYNGLDFNIPPRDIDRRAFLKTCGLEVSDGDVVCGIAARLDPVKDIQTLLRAFVQTPRHMKLVIAGDGAQKGELTSLAEALGISDRVCFAGWIDDIEAFYRSIDINLLTSLFETFPYAVTEGARCRLATISTKVGGIPLLIDHGVNGYLFDPGDADTLAKLLVRLGSDAELRAVFGERIYRKAAENFSIEATISRQVEIYNVLLRRRARDLKRHGVTICGSYGKNNAGDDAILEAIVSEMTDIDPDLRIRVLSRTPKKTRLKYRVDTLYTFNPFAHIRAFRRSRLYINGGGNLIQDITSTRSLLFYLYTIWLGKLLGCKVMMYGCGIGPVSRPSNRRRTARVLDRCVDSITLREPDSREELKRLGVSRPEIVLSADPALILSPSSDSETDSAMISNGLSPGCRYIAFILRNWPSYSQKAEIFGRAADYAFEKHGLVPIFVPLERGKDEAACMMACNGLKLAKPFIISTPEKTSTLLGILSRMDAVVSMRLHGLIFAAGQGVPLVGVSYDTKVRSFLNYMEQDLCISIEDLNEHELISLIDRALKKDRDELRKSVSKLREIEYRNREV